MVTSEPAGDGEDIAAVLQRCLQLARNVGADPSPDATALDGPVTMATPRQPVPALMKESEVLTFDPETLARLRAYQAAGEEDMVSGVLKRFLSGAETQLKAMRAAMARDDVAAAGAAAHGMKSSAAFAGAMRLSAACAQLDNVARGSSMPLARDMFDTLQHEYDAVLPLLQSALQEALRQTAVSPATAPAHSPAVFSPATQGRP